MKNSNSALAVCMIVAVSACAALPALAQKSDDASTLDESLKVYGVKVVKSRFYETFTGIGIYLGRGAVITAAHVVGRWHILTDLQIVIAGEKLPATIVKEGAVDTTDLTVLSVDETRLPVSLRLRRNPVCKAPSRIGQEVVVVAPQGTSRSRVLSPLSIWPEFRKKFGTIIDDVQFSGSGSGVFDANKRCLLGIISSRISRIDVQPRRQRTPKFAKYFVPVADFIPPEYRF
jgi:hypothetical protein